MVTQEPLELPFLVRPQAPENDLSQEERCGRKSALAESWTRVEPPQAPENVF